MILYFSVVWGKKRRPSTFLKDVVHGCSKDFLVKRLRSQEEKKKKKKAEKPGRNRVPPGVVRGHPGKNLEKCKYKPLALSSSKCM